MVKKTLKDAGRYEDVRKVVIGIISKTPIGTYPVNAFVDHDGATRWRVDCISVNNEAIMLLNAIDNDIDTDISRVRLSNLAEYADTHANMLLHNYGNSISHRQEPAVDMEEVRIWLILANLARTYDMDETDRWYIPEGWKRSEVIAE